MTIAGLLFLPGVTLFVVLLLVVGTWLEQRFVEPAAAPVDLD